MGVGSYFKAIAMDMNRTAVLAIIAMMAIVSVYVIATDTDADGDWWKGLFGYQDEQMPEYGTEGYYSLTVQLNNSNAGTLYRDGARKGFSETIQVPQGTKLTRSGSSLIVTGTAPSTGEQETYTYSFELNDHYYSAGWFINPSTTVNSDTTCTANLVLESVTVTFRSSNSNFGTVQNIASADVPYGTTVSANGRYLTVGQYGVGAYPKDDTAQYDYEFSYWSMSSGTLTSDTTITAYFTRTLQKYTVSIATNSPYGIVSKSSVTVDYDSSISSSGTTLTIGSNTITAIPDNDTARYDYSFDGWTGASGTVTGDMTITANFSREINYYTVYIRSSNSEYGSVSRSSVYVAYGTSISANGRTLTIGSYTATATPSQDNGTYTYSFDSWSTTSGTVTGTMTITATFSATVSGHTVSYYYNGAKIDDYTEFVSHGGTITHLTYSSGDMVFCGWFTDPSLEAQYLFSTSTPVEQDYVLYAKMENQLAFTTTPVASATITYLEWAGMVLFDSTGEWVPHHVLWDFGDGTTSTEKTTYHTYSEPGTYTVKLSAYNFMGEVDTQEYKVVIAESDMPNSDGDMLLYIGAVIVAIIALFVITRVI